MHTTGKKSISRGHYPSCHKMVCTCCTKSNGPRFVAWIIFVLFLHGGCLVGFVGSWLVCPWRESTRVFFYVRCACEEGHQDGLAGDKNGSLCKDTLDLQRDRAVFRHAHLFGAREFEYPRGGEPAKGFWRRIHMVYDHFQDARLRLEIF